MKHPYRVTTASRRALKSLAWCLATGLSMMSGVALAQEPQEPGEDPRLYSETVLEEAPGFQLKHIRGFTADDDKPQAYERLVYTLTSREGLERVKMSSALREDLAIAFDETTEESGTAFSLDKRIVDELVVSEETGELTPYLKEIVEADGADTSMKRLGSCSDEMKSRSKSFNFSNPLSETRNFGSGFSGTLSTTGNMSVNATGEVAIRLKRTRITFWCVPVGVAFDHARAWGNAAVSNNATLNGTLNYYFDWHDEVARPHVGSVDFMAGPIPVHIGFKLPIDLGVTVSASATGTVAYNGQQTATGSFDYTCTSSNCSGYANYNLGNAPTPQPVTGSVSGRITPTVWAQVAVRAYLYTEALAYAQIGVRPYLYGDLWGYYGNTCGDADGDGRNETVSALTFDLDWQLYITARASFAGRGRDWNNLWSTPRKHIKFWDLLNGGSSAIRPTLLGPASTPANTLTNYSSRMRPCWPYTSFGDTINSQFIWGDGSATPFNAPPATTTTRGHSWTAAGAKTVQAVALNDSHGRTFTNAVTSRTVQVNGASNPTWTAWINRDSPGGVGDYETLVDIRNEGYAVCANPIAIECQTTSGVNWSSTGQSYSCTPASGGFCTNSSTQYCLDYRVRFLCP